LRIWDHRDLFTVLANLDHAALAKCSLFVFIIAAIVNYFLKSYIPLLLTLVLAGIVFILWSNKDYKPSIMVAVTAITLFAGSSLGGFLGGCSPFRKKRDSTYMAFL
jgi:hypothetical protein